MFSIAICRQLGDKCQSKTLLLTIFDLRSSKVLTFSTAAYPMWDPDSCILQNLILFEFVSNIKGTNVYQAYYNLGKYLSYFISLTFSHLCPICPCDILHSSHGNHKIHLPSVNVTKYIDKSRFKKKMPQEVDPHGVSGNQKRS